MPKFDSIVTAPALSASGLTGATNGARLIGGTTGGAPTSGTFTAGDLAVSSTGSLLVCTTGGSPGTWATSANLSATALQTFAGPISSTAITAAGLTGATSATRYVGATASGAPTSGTFAVGDFVVVQTGAILVNTVAGTPGKWAQVGGGGGTLLGKTVYGPSSYATYTVGTSFAAVDTTNLTVSFVAPASGAVTVRLTGQVGLTASGYSISWGVLSGGSQIGPQAQATEAATISGTIYPEITTDIEVTGLTPGTTYTFQWGAQASNAGQHMYAGPGTNASSTPQAVMKVYDATVSLPAGSQINPGGATLACTYYTPTTQKSYTASATTWTYPYSSDTNMCVGPIVAPQSGQVSVRMHGGLIQSNGVAVAMAGVNTASSGTPLVTQIIGAAINATGATADAGALEDVPFHIEALITGLTPGASYTFYPAIYFYTTNGGLYVESPASTSGSPFFMKVDDATIGATASTATPTAPVVRSASATVSAWETTIGTAAETLTLPSSPVNGTTNTIVAQTGTQTITANTGQTINHYSTTGMSSLVIPAGTEVTLEFAVATSTWYVTNGGFAPGTALATHQYSPGTTAYYTLGAYAAVDTTNATLAFIVPPSGNVDIDVEVDWTISATSSSGSAIVLGLGNHSGGAQLGYSQTAIQLVNAVSNEYAGTTRLRWHLTGLTPGPLQVDLYGYGGGVGTVTQLVANGVTGGGTGSPLLMQAAAS